MHFIGISLQCIKIKRTAKRDNRLYFDAASWPYYCSEKCLFIPLIWLLVFLVWVYKLFYMINWEESPFWSKHCALASSINTCIHNLWTLIIIAKKMCYKNMCVTLITNTSKEWPCFGVLVGNAPWCIGKCKKSKRQPSVDWQIIEFQSMNTEIHLVLYKSRWKRASVCVEVRDSWLHRTNAWVPRHIWWLHQHQQWHKSYHRMGGLSGCDRLLQPPLLLPGLQMLKNSV